MRAGAARRGHLGSAVLAGVLGLWAAAPSGPAHGHLQTPWVPLADALRAGERLVLVRVAGPAQRVGEGTETPVEVEADLSAEPLPPGRLVVWQAGEHRHALEPATWVFLPLERTPAGGWHYPAASRLPATTKPADRALDEAFARTWRAQPPAPLQDGLDTWLGLLDHPAPLARTVATELLVARAGLVRPLMSSARLDRLLDPVLAPGLSTPDRLSRLRLLELVGGKAGALRLAARFERLADDKVRAFAAGILARTPTPETRAVLTRCAAAGGPLGTRCGRLLVPDESAPPSAP